VASGVVTVVAAWMLDPTCCVGMDIGPPRASLALIEVDDLLKRHLNAAKLPWQFHLRQGAAR
jgi:hypothetical protein